MKIIFVLLTVGCNIALANSIVNNNSNESSTKKNNIGLKVIIKAGTHTPEENIRHQKYCAKHGGVDVTDTRDVIISSGTSDPVICISNKTSSAPMNTVNSLK